MKINFSSVPKGQPIKFASYKGPKGDRGPQGPAGKDGRDGKDGIDGKQGIPGRNGSEGLSGRDGIDGKEGPMGPMPKHQVRGDELRFEEAPGIWGKWIKLGTHITHGGGLAGLRAEGVIGLAAYIQEQIGLANTYTRLIDTVDTIKYIGEADAGSSESEAVWRIKRVEFLIDPNTDDIEIKWADGTAAFTKVWNDRASYTYS